MGVGRVMFRYSRCSFAIRVAGGGSGLAICCCAAILAGMPAAAHPKGAQMLPPMSAALPPPSERQHHDGATQAAPGREGEKVRSSDEPGDGHGDAKGEKKGIAREDGQQENDRKDREGAAAQEGANKEPAPPPPKTAAPVPAAPDGPAAPTTNVAEAVAAIAAVPAAVPSSSEASDMMRLGAASGTSPDGRKGAGLQGRARVGSGALALAPIAGTFLPQVVLGYHLRAEVRDQLAQTYAVEAGRSEGVTRLILPDYLGASEEVAALQARFPDQLFGLNYVYSSYRGAGEGGNPPPPAGSAAAGCDAARCYGPAMIGWHADLGACARDVVVGIIDTGLDAKHPALKRLHVIQHPADADRRGTNWHGTAVAALLAGARDSSTPGLIPDAQYVIVDAFFSGSGEASQAGKSEASSERTITDTDHLLWALQALQHRGAEVINMSLVGPSDPAIHAEIRKMAQDGVVFVAAAGNGGPAGAAAFPAAYPEVIAVTAVDRNKRGYAEANHGGYIDVAAPGVRVWTALPGEAHGFLSGTSFAAPFVTAIAAATYNSTPMKVVRGHGRAASPKDEVIGRMAIEKLGTGLPGTRDGVFGLGLARAPAGCSPPAHPQLADRSLPAALNPVARASAADRWQTQIHHASSAP